jgi:NADP-dependent 3-hydroxy acid dehydrogenase YdfG
MDIFGFQTAKGLYRIIFYFETPRMCCHSAHQVALIARNEEKLAALQEELRGATGRPLDSSSFLPLIADVLQPKEVPLAGASNQSVGYRSAQ